MHIPTLPDSSQTLEALSRALSSRHVFLRSISVRLMHRDLVAVAVSL